MDNLIIYNKFKEVPDNAKKPIQAGRLKGKTDINPMWRIKALTEVFGPCGTGWNTVNEKYSLIPVDATQEVICIYELDLVYRLESGKWSDPVHGVGGNMLVAKERGGLYANDEGIKMAKTDALSVAAKALGIGADVYWESDRTKYGNTSSQEAQSNSGKQISAQVTKRSSPPSVVLICSECKKTISPTKTRTAQQVAESTKERYGRMLCSACANREQRELDAIAAEAKNDDAGDRS